MDKFDGAFAAAAATVDQTYTTPDQSHFMMEPHATVARWDGDMLTVWSAQQIVGCLYAGSSDRRRPRRRER